LFTWRVLLILSDVDPSQVTSWLLRSTFQPFNTPHPTITRESLGLAEPPELATGLFRLMADTWRRGTTPIWSSGRLQVHQTEQDAVRGAAPSQGGPAHRLALVVWIDDRGWRQIIGVCPAATPISWT